ncbi:MAG: hypothetical protein OSJ62_02895 [Lachnospiraceae bacterium]|nr:hypothetical protein [Lachnospiraceae bacterium]
MKIKEYSKEYPIIDYSLKVGNGEITLKWNYKKGTHFLVFLYDLGKPFELEKVVQELDENYEEDRFLIQKEGNRLYTTKDGRVKIFLYKEKELIHLSCSILSSEMKRGLPYGVRVLAGEYQKEEAVFYLYREKDLESSTRFVPIKITPEISYKSKLFSKEKWCILRIPQIKDYIDGALEYQIEGIRTTYPIPKSCLNRELWIPIPKNSVLMIKAAEQYKNYYKV